MSGLLGASEIREIAARIGVVPTKKLGQNFVVDANTCRRIVKAADVVSNDIALEIGPGLGSLTLALLECAKEVIALEIDSRLAEELPHTASRHGLGEHLRVINQDAMELDSAIGLPTVLVANLPYNVSVPVFLRALEKLPSLERAVVMVQSEVADRLTAGPGTKSYGSPSVKASWWGKLTPAGSVARSIFWPIPNVDSSLVRFDRKEVPGDEKLRLKTFEIIDGAFAQRRKMLRSALAGILDHPTESIERAGIDPTLRGESLTLKEFIEIAKNA